MAPKARTRHVNTQICNPLQRTVFKDAEHPWKVYAQIFGVSCVHH